MSNWCYTIQDKGTGKPINQAQVLATVSTHPAQPYSGQTSGDGYEFQIQTDGNGYASSNIPYTCLQDLSATISATGYASIDQGYNSGPVTGNIYFTFLLTPETLSGDAQQAANQMGGTPSGQGAQSSGGPNSPSSQFWTQWGEAWSTDVSGANTFVTTNGLIFAVIMVAVAIVAVVVLVMVG